MKFSFFSCILQQKFYNFFGDLKKILQRSQHSYSYLSTFVGYWMEVKVGFVLETVVLDPATFYPFSEMSHQSGGNEEFRKAD